MGTRCGNIDPGIIFYIADRKKMSFEDINRVLQHESGLRGICGSNDMRDIHKRSNEGDARAKLALKMFVYRVKQYIGAYFAILGHVDALVFTAGIGERDAETRKRCCEKMEGFGVFLDPVKNEDPANDYRRISTSDSKVQVLVIPTNEELQIAREAKELLA
jgi:acetate kinase